MSTPTDSVSIHDALKQAMVHFKAGEYQEALRHYQTILSDNPEHPTANHNVGAIALQLNKPGDALGYFNTALKGDPGNEQHWVSLVQTLAVTGEKSLAKEMLQQAQKHGVGAESLNHMRAVVFPSRIVTAPQEAEQEKQDTLALPVPPQDLKQRICAPQQQVRDLTRLLKNTPMAKAQKRIEALSQRYPGDPKLHFMLGHCLLAQKQYQQAEQHFELAASLDPCKVAYVRDLASTYTALGKPGRAVAAYKKALSLTPDNTALLLPLGNALCECYRLDEGIAVYERLLEQQVNSADALHEMAIARFRQHRYEEAKSLLRKAIDLAPDNVKHCNNLGVMLTELQACGEAVALFEQVLKQDPGNIDALLNLALTFKHTGEPERAVAPLRRIMALQPDSAKPYTLLAQTGKIPSDSEDFQVLQRIATSPSASRGDRASAQFVIGNVYLSENRDTDSFAAFHAGNTLAFKGRTAEMDILQQAEKLAGIMDRRYFNTRRPMGSDAEQPLFISGMPRSGKSLLEKLLAQSQEVTAGREMRGLSGMLPGRGDGGSLIRQARSITQGELNQHIKALTRALQASTGANTRYISETTPKTFLMFFYAQMFPAAPVIFCERDPWDLLATCYFKYFRSGHDYSFNIACLEQRIRAEKMLMDHWLEVLPNPCLKIHYEELVRDPQQTGQKMADFLSIDWDHSYGANLTVSEDTLGDILEANPIHSTDFSSAPMPLSKEFIGFGQRFQQSFTPYLSSEAPFTRSD